MFNLFGYLKPAPHIARLPESEHAKYYKRHRILNFICIFLGYASFYLLRKNYTLAMPYLASMGVDKDSMGSVLFAIPAAYGISKFIMGNLSDRSNARYFIATGLIFSVIINLIIGYVPGVAMSISMMFAMLFLNGWAQGMGAPPCYRTVAHWFPASRKGRVMSIWNISHNVGTALLGFLAAQVIPAFPALSWRSIFFLPAIIVSVITVFILIFMRDTPQSVGLPPVEEFEKEYTNQTKEKKDDQERELSAKEILFKYVLVNKYIWFLAFANVFVYFVRYGILDWAPSYFTEVKHVPLNQGGNSVIIYELAGIFGMLLCGYLSDTLFKGNRAIVSILCMVIVGFGVFTYCHSESLKVAYLALFLIGTFIYGPVMLVGVQTLDLMPKKATGTAIGLLGLFGYWGGNVSASKGFGWITHHFGWDTSFKIMLVTCTLAIVFFALTLGAKKREN